MKTKQTTVYINLQETITNLPAIKNERKQVLQPLINYIQEKTNKNEIINLNFICTHNSRRSHLAQIWAQTMAHQYKIRNVNTYSGGTETTALHKAIINTLSNSGFKTQELTKGNNPIYAIKYNDNYPAIIGFSKKYDDDFNPDFGFCAIMTCSQADGGCPFIAGAEARVPITYQDPKEFDNTQKEAEKYKERSLQIATEMQFVFSAINT